jgi:hypothetical protein
MNARYLDICLSKGEIKCILKGCNEKSVRCRLNQVLKIEKDLKSKDKRVRIRAQNRLSKLKNFDKAKALRKKDYHNKGRHQDRLKYKRNRVAEKCYYKANEDRLKEYKRDYYQKCKDELGEVYMEFRREEGRKTYQKRKDKHIEQAQKRRIRLQKQSKEDKTEPLCLICTVLLCKELNSRGCLKRQFELIKKQVSSSDPKERKKGHSNWYRFKKKLKSSLSDDDLPTRLEK